VASQIPRIVKALEAFRLVFTREKKHGVAVERASGTLPQAFKLLYRNMSR
jgi:hypothetical protein